MIYIVWNYCGFGSDTVVRALHGFIRRYRPSIIFLSETKMKNHIIIGVRRRLGFRNGFDVPLVGTAGGLSLWWNDSMEVNVVSANKHLIHMKLRITGDEWFHASWIYGTSYRNEKVEFWHWISAELRPNDIPWIWVGDFNKILSDDEKSRGSQRTQTAATFLQSFMNNLELMDLGFSGPKFTWRGTRNGCLVQERLDRGLINGEWQVRWPNLMIIHESVRASDHCPLILNTDLLISKCKSLFRFEAFWCKKEGCRETIERCWNVGCVEKGVKKWQLKLNSTRSGLKKWSYDNFKHRKHELDRLNVQLGHLQLHWVENSIEIGELTETINNLEAQHEAY
ncbi:hypothetical protein FF2_009016 [Malus domestica]